MGIPISGYTGLYCVFGDPVQHSFSPRLHNKAFDKANIDGVYVAFTANEKTIEAAMNAVRVLGIRGCSVTMPNKLACIPYLDEIDPTAELIGSVNTFVVNEGKIKGYNTDGYGFLHTFEEMGVQIAGSKLVLLGLGGAGSSVALTAAMEYDLGEISIFNRANGRSWPHAQELVALINKKTLCKAKLCDLNDKELLRSEMADAQMLGNTTNVGMGELEGQSVVPDASFFPKDMVVQDAIYSPAKSRLLELAEEAGCRYINGLSMLFYQGARQFKLWTGVDMPLTVDDLEIDKKPENKEDEQALNARIAK